VQILGESATELIKPRYGVLEAGGTIDTFIEIALNYTPRFRNCTKYAAFDRPRNLAGHKLPRGIVVRTAPLPSAFSGQGPPDEAKIRR